MNLNTFQTKTNRNKRNIKFDSEDWFDAKIANVLLLLLLVTITIVTITIVTISYY